MLKNETSPNISDSESCVSASDEDLVPKNLATSTASKKVQYLF